MELSDWKFFAEKLLRLRQDQDVSAEKALYEKILKYIKFHDVKFYRLEDENGLGPFTGFRDGEPESWIDGKCSRRSLCSWYSFVSDVWGLEFKDHFVHACYSVENLKSWFSDEEFNTLLSQGYQVREYSLKKDFKDIFLADNQVLLLKDSRKMVMKEVYNYWKKEKEISKRLIESVF